jgi:hypothetical protein
VGTGRGAETAGSRRHLGRPAGKVVDSDVVAWREIMILDHMAFEADYCAVYILPRVAR